MLLEILDLADLDVRVMVGTRHLPRTNIAPSARYRSLFVPRTAQSKSTPALDPHIVHLPQPLLRLPSPAERASELMFTFIRAERRGSAGRSNATPAANPTAGASSSNTPAWRPSSQLWTPRFSRGFGLLGYRRRAPLPFAREPSPIVLDGEWAERLGHHCRRTACPKSDLRARD
jgi:hypothetical protein